MTNVKRGGDSITLDSNPSGSLHLMSTKGSGPNSEHASLPIPTGDVDYEAVFDATPGFYLVLDKECNILGVNEAYLHATQTTRDIVGRNLFDVFPENPNDPTEKGEENVRGAVQRVLASGKKDVLPVQKYDITAPDGSFVTRYWSPLHMPIFDKNKNLKCILHRVEDVTALMTANDQVANLDKNLDRQKNELVSALKELKIAKEEAEQANQAKTVFFNNVSHEFRTPLTLILGHIEDLLGSVNSEATLHEKKDLLISLQRNSMRLLKLVNTLLDFSRLEEKRLEAYYEPIDLATFTAEIASSFSSELQKCGIQYSVITPELSQPVYVDRDLWEKIVLNLLSNAFKYTKAGSITGKLTEDATGVELSISDTGIGIPEKDLPHIFERFYTVEQSKGRSIEGVGIGLSLVKEIVELHKGEVHVESTLNQGTTFRVKIPLGTSHLPPEKLRSRSYDNSLSLTKNAFLTELSTWSDAKSNKGESLGQDVGSEDGCLLSEKRARVLVVDDNKDMRHMIGGTLGKFYEVVFAENGKIGLAKARQLRPDIILTDINMPEMNGFEFLAAIREEKKIDKTPVIMLSAHASEEVLLEGLNASANDYLSKPFSAKVLLARIRTQLELRDLRERLDKENRNQFIDSVCHEIRNSLVVIKGYATILDGTVRSSGGWNDTHFPPEFPNLASNILQATEDQTEILDKVLVLSKLENNPDTLNETTFNPKQIVQEVHRSLETSAKDKKLDFLLELPSEEISITSDAGCLKNVLVSLLSNAIKYTESGHVCLKLEYPTMDEKNNSPVLLFTVEDTSVGLSPDEIPLIFSRFSQCLPGSTKKAGYGLGLAICKELVTSLGGTIWVESAGDSGTKFHFTISPKVIEERERNSRTSTVSRSPSPYRSLSPANRTMLSPRGIAPLGGEISFIALDILVVDDNSLVRKLLIMQLPKGNHVMEAVDGADAVEKYQKKKPDIIFMDLRMPVLDGFGATEEIRQIEETCHMTRAVIIGISADAREVYALKAKDIGMDDFFAKPVSRHKLEEKIQEIQSSKK